MARIYRTNKRTHRHLNTSKLTTRSFVIYRSEYHPLHYSFGCPDPKGTR